MQVNARVNIGSCPHGMSPGACPVCSGMGAGGGGGSSRKSGEMSWNECYAIGQMMKAEKMNAALDKQAFQNHLNIVLMENKMNALAAQKQLPLINFIQNRVLMPLANITQSVKQELARLISQPLNNLSNMLNQAQNKIKEMLEKFPNIADKLAAIFGDEENSIRDKVSKNLNKLKKKVFSFFEMIDGEMTQGETEEFDKNITEEIVKYKLNRESQDDTVYKL